MTKFIKSKLTLEQYVTKFEPSLNNSRINGALVTFSGNNAIFTVDLDKDPEAAKWDPNNITQEQKNAIYNKMGEFQGVATEFRTSIENNTGIKGAGVTVVYKLKGVELVRRSF